jgi:hypothetical protein
VAQVEGERDETDGEDDAVPVKRALPVEKLQQQDPDQNHEQSDDDQSQHWLPPRNRCSLAFDMVDIGRICSRAHAFNG